MPIAARLIPVAQYIRMSTDRQDLSVEMQRSANAAFARLRGYEIVRTYTDEGISGVGIEKRIGLKALLAQVVAGLADFTVILVYDVSRWGRFQNNDEGAHYEFLCAEAGVQVEYSAESFANDGSVAATLLKALKRAMAAEYSRELSVKVALSHRRAAERGFWTGGSCGYGLRRQAVSRNGRLLGRHGFGDPKEQGAHTRLVEGPPHEVATVRRIYRMYLKDGRSMREIARLLNAEGIASDRGRLWSGPMVHTVLTSEKYAGRMVRGRTRSALGGLAQAIDEKDWQVIEGAAPQIVSRRLWRAVQLEMRSRRAAPSRESLLDDLRRLGRKHACVTIDVVRRYGRHRHARYYAEFGSLHRAVREAGCAVNATQVAAYNRPTRSYERGEAAIARAEHFLVQLRGALLRHGYLSHQLVKHSPDLPDPSTYAYHFGSLGRAYALVGYVPEGKQATMIRRKTQWVTPNEAEVLVVQADARFNDGYVSQSPEDLITAELKALLQEKGKLTRAIIDAAPNLPSAVSLVTRMGSMQHVYAAAGFAPGKHQTSMLSLKKA